MIQAGTIRRALVFLVSACVCSIGAAQQPSNPVYLDDAPVALETIDRAMERVAQGSMIEAARTLGDLIVEYGDRLILDPDAPGTSIPVRRRVQSIVLADPDLLDAYLDLYSETAARRLEDGATNDVWSRFWLTDSGAEASLRFAQVLIESGATQAGSLVLQQLFGHPNANDAAPRAVTLLTLATRVDGPDSRSSAILGDWCELLGITTPMIEPLIGLTEQTQSPKRVVHWDDGFVEAAPDLSGLVSTPIAVQALTPKSGLDVAEAGVRTPTRPKPWTEPVVTSDSIVVNDGVTISCFDRFTMRPRWRLSTTSEDNEDSRSNPVVRSRLARTIEDLSSVSIRDGVVYAATGLARTGGRTEDARLLSIDLESGAIIHETTLSDLDPDLEDASVRGGVLIVGDTLVVGARKNQRRQRLVALSLVGINRRTFEHEWTTPIASAGSLPFQQVGRVAHWGSTHEGIVYWSDEMGVACAVVGATGEVRWARALPESDLYARGERDAWTVPAPLVHGEHVYVLASDGSNIHQLDIRTGREIATIRANASGDAQYLIDTGTYIGCVGRFSVSLHEPDRFGQHKLRIVTPTGDGRTPMTGRVVAQGDSLLLPINGGVALSRIDEIGDHRLIEIDRTGISIALEGQLVVVTENDIAGYLAWDTARRVLGERIELESDASSAVSLAELAFRSSRTDEIIEAVDIAIRLLAADPSERIRSRLFSALLEMVRPDSDLSRVVPLKTAIRESLIDRLGQIARDPDQRLAHTLVQGSWFAATSRDTDAARAYHRVLADERLRGVMWEDEGFRVRGEIEALKRLDDLVDQRGRRVCAPLDGAALVELEALGSNPSASDLESVARRFPWAKTTPNAWVRAASAYADQSAMSDASRAAESALLSAQRLDGVGTNVQDDLILEAGSKLVTALQTLGFDDRAARELRRWERVFGDRAFERPDGSRITLTQSPGSQRLAAIGTRIDRDTPLELLAGFPLRRPERSDTSSVLLYAPQLARVAHVTLGAENETPTTSWERFGSSPEAPIILIHSAQQSVLLWAPGPGAIGGVLEAIDNQTGQTRWRIESCATEIREGSRIIADREARAETRITDPVTGPVAISQLVSVSDGTNVVISDRVGRAMCVETMSGRIIWRRELPVNRLHELDLRDGVLGVAGMRVVDADADIGRSGSSIGVIAALDGQTGDTIQSIEESQTVPRWVRVGSSGELIAATSRRVLSLSIRRGGINWVAQNNELILSRDAWVIDDRLYVLGESALLLPMDRDSGRPDAAPIILAGRMTNLGSVGAHQIAQHTVFVAPRGLGIFNESGDRVAIDAGRAWYRWTDAAPARDRIVTARQEITDPGSEHTTRVRLFDVPSGLISDELLLTIPIAQDRSVMSVDTIDGAIILGFGEVSVLLRVRADEAPSEPEPIRQGS